MRHATPGLAGDDVLLLCRRELRAVDLEERLTPAHRLPGLIHEQALDPALEARRHNGEPPLVDGDGAYCPDGARHRALGRDLGPDAEHLHALRADGDRARGLVRLVLVDGEVVHAHRILLGHRRGVGHAHRVAVVEDSAAPTGRCWCRRRHWRGGRRRGAGILVDRDEVAPVGGSPWRRRVFRPAVRGLVVEWLARRRRRLLRLGWPGHHPGQPVGSQPEATRCRSNKRNGAGRLEPSRSAHRLPPSRRSIAASWRWPSNSAARSWRRKSARSC